MKYMKYNKNKTKNTKLSFMRKYFKKEKERIKKGKERQGK